MKKLLLFAAISASIAVSGAQEPEIKDNKCAAALRDVTEQCDSVNMPVFIVDGVEVQDVSGIASDDIVKVEVIKDTAVTRIFSPRLGGVVRITTKSRKFLIPVLEEYNKQTEEQRQQRIPGKLLVR